MHHGMLLKLYQRFLARHRIPDRDHPIIRPDREQPSIGRPGQRTDGSLGYSPPLRDICAARAIVSILLHLAAQPIPETDNAIISSHCQFPPSRGKSQSTEGGSALLIEAMKLLTTRALPNTHYPTLRCRGHRLTISRPTHPLYRCRMECKGDQLAIVLRLPDDRPPICST